MSEIPKLTAEAERAVQIYVSGLVGNWLRWIGVANALTLASIIAYVVFVLPDVAAERLVPGMSRRVENLTADLEKKLGDSFELSGRVRASFEDMNARSAELRAGLSRLETELQVAQRSELGEIARVVTALGASRDVPDLLRRTKELEEQVAVLGDSRGGHDFRVSNPVMGGQVAKCPPGTFVSSISAPKGVGGRYGVDGISELSVECSRVR